MDILKETIDRFIKKEFDGVFYYVGIIYALVFPSLIYIVLFEFSLFIQLDTLKLLLLAMVYNVIVLTFIIIIIFDHQVTFVIADARKTIQSGKELMESFKMFDDAEVKISRSEVPKDECTCNNRNSNQKDLILGKAMEELKKADEIYDNFYISVFNKAVKIAFLITFLIVIFWSQNIDLKSLFQSIKYIQLILVMFAISGIISLIKIGNFNRKNPKYKINHHTRLVILLLVLLTLVFDIFIR